MTLITCQQHDYIEIACLYGYTVRLTLKNGQVIEGKAIDTCTDTEKREHLVLEADGRQWVELIQLAGMDVLNDKPAFKSVRF